MQVFTQAFTGNIAAHYGNGKSARRIAPYRPLIVRHYATTCASARALLGTAGVPANAMPFALALTARAIRNNWASDVAHATRLALLAMGRS